MCQADDLFGGELTIRCCTHMLPEYRSSTLFEEAHRLLWQNAVSSLLYAIELKKQSTGSDGTLTFTASARSGPRKSAQLYPCVCTSRASTSSRRWSGTRCGRPANCSRACLHHSSSAPTRRIVANKLRSLSLSYTGNPYLRNTCIVRRGAVLC